MHFHSQRSCIQQGAGWAGMKTMPNIMEHTYFMRILNGNLIGVGSFVSSTRRLILVRDCPNKPTMLLKRFYACQG